MPRIICRSRVSDVATKCVVSVEPTMKLDDIAKQFDQHNISAAPVVDGFGKCIGIITSRDLVRYESLRSAFDGQFQSGIAFEISQPKEDSSSIEMREQPFDEVAYHMTREFRTVNAAEPLGFAGCIMCRERIHHLVVLDDAGRPGGILSTLDILGDVLGEAVSCQPSVA